MMKTTLVSSLLLFSLGCGGAGTEPRDELGAYKVVADRMWSKLDGGDEGKFRRTSWNPHNPGLSPAQAEIFAEVGWEELAVEPRPVPDTTWRVLSIPGVRSQGTRQFIDASLIGYGVYRGNVEFWGDSWRFEFQCDPACVLMSETYTGHEDGVLSPDMREAFFDSLAARDARPR